MKRRMCSVGFVVLQLVLAQLLPAAGQQESSGREQLQEYVAQLRTNPDDQGLRERIIKLALTLQPRPASPEGALEAEGAAEYAAKHAGSKEDFAKAGDLYDKALLIAPWNAKDYFNAAVCREKAEQYNPAINDYKLYLVGAPDASDRDEVLKKIGAMKYAANQSSPQAIAERNARQAQAAAEVQQQEERNFLNSLNGNRYSCWFPHRPHTAAAVFVLDIRGGQAIFGEYQTYPNPDQWNYDELGRALLTGKHFRMDADVTDGTTFTVSDDGLDVVVRGSRSGPFQCSLEDKLRMTRLRPSTDASENGGWRGAGLRSE